MYSKVLYREKCNYCIRYWACKKGFTTSMLSKALNISRPTTYKLIENPFLMTLQQLYTMAGLFGITVEEFVYCLSRNKPKIKTREDRWYLSDSKDKGEKMIKG